MQSALKEGYRHLDLAKVRSRDRIAEQGPLTDPPLATGLRQPLASLACMIKSGSWLIWLRTAYRG